MGEIITPGTNPRNFLKHAMKHGYGMEPSLISPDIGAEITQELARAGQLVDYNELKPTAMFNDRGMRFASMLHGTLSRIVRGVDPSIEDPLPLFSVRVFQPGKHATTIHRNHESVRPWAIGTTLVGEAPFNVYDQDQLPAHRTIQLQGDDQDPEPLETMNASAGSAWTLYTAHEQMPHSGGIVSSETVRVLLLLYNRQYLYH